MTTLRRLRVPAELLVRARAVPNPYLAEAAPLLGPPNFAVELRELKSGNPSKLLARHEGRSDMTNRYAWAVPNAEALAAIAHFSRGRVVEVGAGTGYWASLLAQLGVDVIAYDRDRPGENNRWHPMPGTFHPVVEDPAESGVTDSYQDRLLFICWPPYDEPMAADALWHYAGVRVAYVGEGSGGCTADDAFHAALDKGFELVDEVDIPQWYGIHDRLELWERRTCQS